VTLIISTFRLQGNNIKLHISSIYRVK